MEGDRRASGDQAARLHRAARRARLAYVAQRGGVETGARRGRRHPGARAGSAVRGVTRERHALRHFYATVLLDAGENIKALAEYLGHSDPGLTLRVYAHLMPTSSKRTRRAVHNIYSESWSD